MARGVLFIGGRGPTGDIVKGLIQDSDLICAADSGLDAALDAGIRPDGIVGDMDSISDVSLLDGFPSGIVERHPTDKDDTDTEIGLAWLRSRGCAPLVLIGGGEGRLDHTVAILNLFSRPDHPQAWYTALEEVRSLQGEHELQGRRGSRISFAPVGPGPWLARSQGLDWPLDGVFWASGQMSLSNRFISTTAQVNILSGTLLSFRPLDF